MDADEGSKHNQKFVRKGSQVLYEIISDRERLWKTEVGILLMRNEEV